MKLSISALFRVDAYTHNFDLPPSALNPGGGLAKKAQQLKLALPIVEFTSDFDTLGEIVLFEPLSLTSRVPEGQDFGEVVYQRAQAYVEHKAFKVLWTSDFDLFRWPADVRSMVLDATDVVCGNSPYMVDVLRAFAPSVELLTDPFDMNSVLPAPVKAPSIYSCSQAIVEKRIHTIAAVYEALTVLQCGFVGSSAVWGLDNEPSALESRLVESTDWHIPSAPSSEVAGIAAQQWGYICDAGMETFGYGLAEAMAGGAECFCGEHLAYSDRPVHYFSSVEEAVALITERFKASDFTPQEAPQQWISEHCSLDVFRSQFWSIVGGAYGVG